MLAKTHEIQTEQVEDARKKEGKKKRRSKKGRMGGGVDTVEGSNMSGRERKRGKDDCIRKAEREEVGTRASRRRREVEQGLLGARD